MHKRQAISPNTKEKETVREESCESRKHNTEKQLQAVSRRNKKKKKLGKGRTRKQKKF